MAAIGKDVMEMADEIALIPAAPARLNRGKACLEAVRTIALIIARMPGHRFGQVSMRSSGLPLVLSERCREIHHPPLRTRGG